ncbi:GNAT family N-acetyltransferase [Hwangdonia lutea]|uniref:GNAT family N-acetyltransferase n=1 Tax=Hwangdonia lutea TaxID=3075823 RepID=A0AA97HT02_9FLAO|nr:GNAT family N-acetyltransferase [Hwangdonia sp. SCSIO 19198]WOD45018.1 GNAT family N-acetyltransferase [Hwangdonia sp. SCSIO 19198]
MIDYKIYNTVNQLPKSWDALPHHDIFLKTTFLKGLELSSPYNITPYYLGVFKNEKLVGIAIIKRVEMYADDIFRNNNSPILKQIAKQLVSKIIKGNALIIGSLMHTGQHGIYYNAQDISQNEYLDQLEKALRDLTIRIKSEFNKKIRIIAFKDYFENDAIHKSPEFFKKNNLYKVQVQPNMVLSISDRWKSPDDYVASLNKKYKKRFKTARKKASNIIWKELNEDFIKANSETLFELYETVSDNARVNSFKLHKSHFYNLKVSLGEKLRVFGFFLNDELIGFYTLILNNDVLETYFLGYNKELQRKHQLYLNMLFNMAFFGIENGFKTIVYARTAMEIKSSIGAKPKTMHVYLKHTNNFIANTILKCIVKYMNPIRKWEERHPFR